MPFIGFSFDKISAERKKSEFKGNINIKHSINVKEILEEDINLEKKQDVLRFRFEFTLIYEPGVGEVDIEGHLIYIENPKKLKEIYQKWKKDKKISPEIMQGLFNTIITKSNIKALELSQDLNLPPHLPMPKLTRQQPRDIKEYIG